MTGPLDFLYQNKTTPIPSSNSKQEDPLAFLYNTPKQESAQKQEGFFDTIGNFAKNWISQGAVKSIENTALFLDPLNSSRLLQDPSVQQAAKDLTHILDFNFSSPIEASISIGQSIGSQPSSPGNGLLSELAMGVVKPVIDLGELSSGLKLTEDDVKPLTIEEKTDRIKSAVGLIAASAIAGPLSTAIASKPLGGIVSRIAAKSGVGAVAGGIYGGVSSSGNRDEVAQIISGAMIGGVLGALGRLRPEKIDPLVGQRSINYSNPEIQSSLRNRLLAPEDVAQARQIQVENNSVNGTIKMAQALATNDDVAAALLEGKIGLKSGDAHIIPGVNPSNLNLLQSKLPEGYRSVMHIDDGGVGHLLVYDSNVFKIPAKQVRPNPTFLDRDQTRKSYTEGIVGGYNTEFQVYVDDYPELGRTKSGYRIQRSDVDKYGFDVVTASKDPIYNKIIATIRFSPTGKMEHLAVQEKYRGKGIASDLLAFAESQGRKISAENISSEPVSVAGAAVVNKFINKNTLDETFYQKNGLLKDQQVSYLGQDHWKIKDVAKDGSILLENQNNPSSIISANKNDIRLPANVILDSSKSSDLLYGEWKSAIEGSVSETVKEKGVIDSSIPSSILDRIPDLHQVNLRQHIESFLNSKGFSEDEIQSLSRDFQRRLSKEAYAGGLEPEELDVVTRPKSSPKEVIATFKQLDRVARSNGFRVTDGGSGRVIVRDLKTDRILRGFDTPVDAAKWMNKTGQDVGPRLDDNTTIDTGIAGGNNPPLPPEDGVAYANDEMHNYINNKQNKGESFLRFLDNFGMVTRYQDLMKHIDAQYGTNFYNRIFDKLHQSFNVRNAKLSPYADELASIKKRFKNLKEEDWQKVMTHMQAMKPEEVIQRYMNRPMNPFEIQMAKQLAKDGVDKVHVFKYRRELEKLNLEYPQDIRVDPAVDAEYQNHLRATQEAFGMDQKHLEWANAFDQIEEMNMKDGSLGAIVRLADSIDSGVGSRELSQSEYAAKNKLSFDHILASNQLADMYKRLAQTFGISGERQLGQFATHARLYFDGDISRATKQFSGDIKTKEFYARLARTGEISAFETNAAQAMQRYLKAGFDSHSGFFEAIRSAKTALGEELAKIPDSGKANHVNQQVSGYIENMQGFPGASDRAAQEAINKLTSALHIDKEINLRAWINSATSLVASGGLGLRPMLGIGHFGISSIISTAARSHSYTMRMLKAGASAISHGDIMQELQERGVLAGLSPIATMTSAEYAGTIRGAIGKTQQALFKGSLLPTVYDGMAAGHYITANADALSALTRFGRKEITWNQVEKETFLNRFDAPIVEQFTKLAKDGKIEAASDYLGRQAIEDLVGTYGAGSHPVNWSSNLGRVAGQFGNFATFVRAAVTRIASRGTTMDRINGVAKLIGYSAAAHEAGNELGLNLSRMAPFHAMFWLFGPGINVAEDAVTAVKGTGYEQQSALRRLTKLSPIGLDKNGDATFHPSILMPASFAIDGLINGIESINNGEVGLGLGEVLGFRRTQQAQKGGL